MLHGSVLKTVIWCFTIIGLTPALLLALLALAFTALAGETRPPTPRAVPVLRSNFWLQVGPIRLEDWHPRAWASMVLAVGAVLIIVALFFLLHVPRTT
jgi:hypothetical protein